MTLCAKNPIDNRFFYLDIRFKLMHRDMGVQNAWHYPVVVTLASSSWLY
jgi:hypothetical protein